MLLVERAKVAVGGGGGEVGRADERGGGVGERRTLKTRKLLVKVVGGR